MKLGNRIYSLRKEKKMTRDEIGKLVGTSGAVIGRYERDEITPSVEIAKKISDALDVSLDYLIGSSNLLVKDKKMLYRLELLQKIEEQDRNIILKVLDSLLKDAQLTLTQQRLA